MPKKKLLDIVREKIRLRHYSFKTDSVHLSSQFRNRLLGERKRKEVYP
jgi:hypothetical protein